MNDYRKPTQKSLKKQEEPRWGDSFLDLFYLQLFEDQGTVNLIPKRTIATRRYI